MYRTRINSYNELPNDKRPPRNLWDKPHKLEQFMEDVFKTDTSDKGAGKTYIEFNPEEVE